MALMKSISGIRGTIGGCPNEGLNPLSISRFTYAYALQRKQALNTEHPTIIVGRDARISGPMVRDIVVGTLTACGCHVLDIGLATTPTTEMAVLHTQHAAGGIIITASHNPKEWNALKLLNEKGEFISDQEGKKIIAISEDENLFQYAPVEEMGSVSYADFLPFHVDKILALPEINVDAIKKTQFSVAFDGINSVGGIALPYLLERLGVSSVFAIHDKPTGDFAHNPEPLPKHLTELSQLVLEHHADLGIAVDPDVDRLALYDEKGNPFGEEYTLVAVADYMLSYHGKGNTVSNLSSSRALRDITEKRGLYTPAAVGEVNVVKQMKDTKALIGGEGNGGVILPSLHYGRDALVGIALILSFLAEKKCSLSTLRTGYPAYYMCKERVNLPQGTSFHDIKESILSLYPTAEKDTTDGIKFDFPANWLHIRSSNTEPILRIYSEARSEEEALALAREAKTKIESLLFS